MKQTRVSTALERMPMVACVFIVHVCVWTVACARVTCVVCVRVYVCVRGVYV